MEHDCNILPKPNVIEGINLILKSNGLYILETAGIKQRKSAERNHKSGMSGLYNSICIFKGVLCLPCTCSAHPTSLTECKK